MMNLVIVIAYIISSTEVEAYTESIETSNDSDGAHWIHVKSITTPTDNYGRAGFFTDDDEIEAPAQNTLIGDQTQSEMDKLHDATNNGTEKGMVIEEVPVDNKTSAESNSSSEETLEDDEMEHNIENVTDEIFKHSNSQDILIPEDETDFIDSVEEKHITNRRLDIENTSDVSQEVDIDRPMLDLYDHPQRSEDENPIMRAMGGFTNSNAIVSRRSGVGVIRKPEPRLANLREQPFYRPFSRLGPYRYSNLPSAPIFSNVPSYDRLLNSRRMESPVQEFQGNEKTTPNPYSNAYPYEPEETEAVQDTWQKLVEATKVMRQGIQNKLAFQTN